MKKFCLVFMAILACFVVSSCTQDDNEISENTVRDTQTDMEILSRFVDIDENTNEYYINENKKTRALSYITDQDYQEIQKVSPVNYEKFSEQLRLLNEKVASAINNPNTAYIVFSVNDKTIVKKIRETNFEFSKTSETGNIVQTRALPYSLGVYGGSNETTGPFKDASRTIKMTVTLDPILTGKYYFFDIISPNAKPSPDPDITTPQTIAFSGTAPFLTNNTFTWTAYWQAQGNDGLFNWEFKSYGYNPSSGNIAMCKFSY